MAENVEILDAAIADARPVLLPGAFYALQLGWKYLVEAMGLPIESGALTVHRLCRSPPSCRSQAS